MSRSNAEFNEGTMHAMSDVMLRAAGRRRRGTGVTYGTSSYGWYGGFNTAGWVTPAVPPPAPPEPTTPGGSEPLGVQFTEVGGGGSEGSMSAA